MGQRILLSCEKCGCKKEMSVGAGLMSNRPDIIASCLNEEESGKWQELYGHQETDSYHAEQKVFYCENCKDLLCQFVVDITLKDGKKVTLGNKCNKCGSELQEVSLQTHHMVCPVCKEGDLSWKQMGLWD